MSFGLIYIISISLFTKIMFHINERNFIAYFSHETISIEKFNNVFYYQTSNSDQVFGVEFC